MKTAEADFHFPVLGFTSDLNVWGFQDLDRLTKCGPRTLKENTQIGMELVDADGRRWKVRSVRRTGRAGSLLNLLLPFGPAQSRIEHDLEPMEAASIEEVHDRICKAMEAQPEVYFYGDEHEADFDPPLSVVRATSSISALYDLLQPDTFEPH